MCILNIHPVPYLWIETYYINFFFKSFKDRNINIHSLYSISSLRLEIVAAQGKTGVTVSRRFWVRSPLEKRNIYLNLYFYFVALVSRQSAAMSSATQHAKHPELSGKWRTECLNTRFPLPALLCTVCCIP